MATILAIIGAAFWLTNSSADTTLVESYSVSGFDDATYVLVAPDEKVFVIDGAQNRLYVFDDPQKLPRSVGGYGWSQSSFDRPTAVATDGVNIFVSDYGNHRIQRFDRNLNFVSQLSTRDTSAASVQFGYPLGIALSTIGDLYILDGENLRILKYAFSGQFDGSFASINRSGGKLEEPVKIVALGTQKLFVAERRRIMIFDMYGNYITTFGEQYLQRLSGMTVTESGVIAVSSDTLWWFDLSGTFRSMLPAKHIVAEVTLKDIRDIGWRGDKIYLLTPKRLHIMRLHFAK